MLLRFAYIRRKILASTGRQVLERKLHKTKVVKQFFSAQEKTSTKTQNGELCESVL